jgi:hypothetical protein
MSENDSLGEVPQRRLFDSHCHIIDHCFPIVANQGYIPPTFPLEAYLAPARTLPGRRLGTTRSPCTGSSRSLPQ